MGVLERIPKSFLLGVAAACVLCVIGLIVHITYVNSSSRGEADSEGPARPYPPPSPNKYIPSETSRLGIYSKAAVATDSRPCAKIGA